MKYILVLFFIVSTFSLSISQKITGQELLNKSIKYHDPSGQWDHFDGNFSVLSSTPTRDDRTRDVYLDNANQIFKMTSGVEHIVSYSISPEKTTVMLDGESNISEKDQKKYRANEDGAHMFRNYITYLYGLPMKLKDPGAIIHPEVKDTVFFNIPSLRLKVTYDPKVGDDIWYFYFDKKNFSLKAYQFYHDESKNDGEYILLDGEALFQKIKMPAVRKWYYNKDDTYLGTDTLK